MVAKAVLTGILKIGKEKFSSGFNFYVVLGVLSNDYSEYFGFTQDEVDMLLDENLDGTEEERNASKIAIKNWYNGYNIGKNFIYNSWSIMFLFAAARKIQNLL